MELDPAGIGQSSTRPCFITWSILFWFLALPNFRRGASNPLHIVRSPFQPFWRSSDIALAIFPLLLPTNILILNYPPFVSAEGLPHLWAPGWWRWKTVHISKSSVAVLSRTVDTSSSCLFFSLGSYENEPIASCVSSALRFVAWPFEQADTP